MEEGFFEAATGGADEVSEERDSPAAQAGSSAESFAAAIAAIASRQDPGVAKKTEEFLTDQSRLLRLQASHLEAEHALRLRQLRHQVRLSHGQQIGQTLRIVVQCCLVVFGILVCVGIAILLHDAFASRSIVIEEFDVPPALASHGLTGKVVAGDLLDALAQLRSSIHLSTEAERDVSNAWSNRLKVDIPESGVSIAEVSATLRSRFGHDLRISGDLVEALGGNVALTVRGDGVPSKTFVQSSENLSEMIDKAAEYIYAESQPSHWIKYLTTHGRNEEAIAFAQESYGRTSVVDRPQLLNSWGNALVSLGRKREALEMHRRSVRLDPELFSAYGNIIADQIDLGDEEGAWQAGEAMRRAAGGRPGRALETYYNSWDILTYNLLPALTALIKDRDHTAGVGSTSSGSIGVDIASLEFLLHDRAAAELSLQTEATQNNNLYAVAQSHFIRGQLAREAGDIRRALSEMEAFQATCAAAANCEGSLCSVALAEEDAGNHAGANVTLAAGGHFVDCYRFRADILDMRGSWGESQKAYEAAVQVAPDLPAAYYSWGLALARHGDINGAIAKFTTANQRGKHWADPLKAWGDVLLKQGKTKAALEKYDEALDYAPNWQQLKEARAAAANQRL